MLDISRDIQSLTDFKKNTPEFIQQLKETGEPIVNDWMSRLKSSIKPPFGI
mgnify:CR=1 FL=1